MGVTAGRIKKLLKRDGNVCWICGLSFHQDIPERRMSLDHIIPKSKGGSSEIHNLKLAHIICNSMRGNADACMFKGVELEHRKSKDDKYYESFTDRVNP